MLLDDSNQDRSSNRQTCSDSFSTPLKPTVLVIDDNQIVLTYLTMLLDEKLNVLTALTATEGLEILNGGHNISCVLLELMLPDLNGLELLKRLRNNKKTSHVHVIVISGSNNNEWILRSVNMNIQGYFKKPFDGAALSKRIMDLCAAAETSAQRVLKELWGDDFEQRVALLGPVVKAAIAFIDSNFHTRCRREEVADYLNLSPDHLSRRFKKETGLSLNTYITRCRLHLSRELLINQPTEKVKNIAQYTGISDVDYFCKLFKNHTGYTPKQYRLMSNLVS